MAKLRCVECGHKFKGPVIEGETEMCSKCHGETEIEYRYEALFSPHCAPADYVWAVADYEKCCTINRFKTEQEAKEHAAQLNRTVVG